MYSIVRWVKPYLMALKLTVEENVVLATFTKLNFTESNKPYLPNQIYQY